MGAYKIFMTKKAAGQRRLLKAAGLEKKARQLIDILSDDPYQTPPTYEKLVGDLAGAYSRRINLQHRLVYEVIEEDKTVKILSMWSHYER